MASWLELDRARDRRPPIHKPLTEKQRRRMEEAGAHLPPVAVPKEPKSGEQQQPTSSDPQKSPESNVDRNVSLGRDCPHPTAPLTSRFQLPTPLGQLSSLPPMLFSGGGGLPPMVLPSLTTAVTGPGQGASWMGFSQKQPSTSRTTPKAMEVSTSFLTPTGIEELFHSAGIGKRKPQSCAIGSERPLKYDGSAQFMAPSLLYENYLSDLDSTAKRVKISAGDELDLFLKRFASLSPRHRNQHTGYAPGAGATGSPPMTSSEGRLLQHPHSKP